MKLCKRHHGVLCDQLPDAVLDALGIPASDSGDFRHVLSQFEIDADPRSIAYGNGEESDKSECEVCARVNEELYRVNTLPGLWHVDMGGYGEQTEENVRFFNQATDEIPAPLVCGDLDWWYVNEQAAIDAQQVFLRYDFMTEVTNELLRLRDF
jgi:hypothetical protein